MRKIFIAFLSCMLVCMCVLHVAAAEEPKLIISVSDTSVSRGETITVTVSSNKIENCTVIGMGIYYDTSIFEMVDDSFDMIMKSSSATFVKVEAESAIYVAKINKPENGLAEGDIFSFQLKVKSDAKLNEKTTIVGIPSIRINNQAVNSKIENATVKTVCTHSYDKGKVTTEPTCAKEGTKTYTCTICGKTKTESIAKVAHTYDNACDTACNSCGATRTVTHSWNSGKVTTEPTCTDTGVKTFTCTVCSATKTESVEATGHDYGSYKTTKEPTCTEEGVKTATCKICGGTKTKSIESNGHSYNDGEVTKEATCTEKGKTTYTCTVCSYTKTSSTAKIDHQYDGDCDADCNACGAEREIQHDLVWTCDENEHWEQCTRCGYALPAAEHACEETMTYDQSVHGYLCTVCGLYPQGMAHEFDNDCDTTCDACGYERGITHNYSSRWSMNEDGHWYECTVCGDQLEMELHVAGEEATETTDQICIICGYVLEYAENHQHFMAGDWLCNELGHWFQCGCGAFVEPVEHSWGEGVIDEEDLVIVYTCTDCGFFKSEEYIPPTEPPAPTDPEDETQPTEGLQPNEDPNHNDQPKGDALLQFGFDLGKYHVEVRIELWMILAACLAVSVILNVILIIALAAKKKPGRFDNKKSSETGEATQEDDGYEDFQLPED